ncbi:MAG: hypothetical protein M5U34_42345 [Chloroflexi bacterium]|nr:hypothetical protein [Chloroflexota bacterium]
MGKLCKPNTVKNDVDWIQILDIDEGEGKQFTGLDQDNNYFVEQIFYINGYFYDFRFIQATNTLAYLDIGYEMLSSIVLDGVPESYPSPDYSALGINLENFNFQPIKIPFQNGTGNITSGGGYNNGSNHNYYDKYALDVCENGTCSQNDRYAIAPTDITFVHTASNQTDYHFFEIDNDGSNKLCMSLAHFNFGNFGVPIVSGMHFPRGAVLGPLSNYSPPHLHIGIWSVPASSNCWYGTRTAITFEGSYQLNGVSYGACWPTGNDCYNVHANRPVTSTNYPICAMPSMNGNITNTEINEVQAITTSPGDCFGSGTLDPPALISPNNGERLTNRSVHFVWQSPNSTNQNGYTFRLNSSSNPDTQPWIEDTGLGNEYTSYGYELPSDGTFYWHMRTWNTSNEASAWVTRQFHIDTSGGSDDVVLCGTDDASSDCWIFPLGVYSDLSTWGLNDRMRSAIVPSGKSVFLFREGGLRGTAECFSGNRIPLPSGDPWDLRGQVTGVQVFHQSGCPTSQLYSVVMYDNQNYGSHHWGIGYNEGVHNLNQIGGPDDAYFNDRGESVRIPSGWSVRLYEHNDRGGQSSGCLTGDVSSLGSFKQYSFFS